MGLDLYSCDLSPLALFEIFFQASKLSVHMDHLVLHIDEIVFYSAAHIPPHPYVYLH